MTKPDFTFASLFIEGTEVEQASVFAYQGMFMLQWEQFVWGLTPEEWIAFSKMIALAEKLRASMDPGRLSAILGQTGDSK